MIRSAIELFREHGYSGTGLREINAHSGVARGAIYHHFPGGKAELAEEVLVATGQMVKQGLAMLASSGDAVAMLDGFVAAWKQNLAATGYRAGCSVVAIVAESRRDAPQLARTAARVFASWNTVIAGVLARQGVKRAEARRLATLTVSSIEGGVILCRAAGEARALDEVGSALRSMYRAAIESVQGSRNPIAGPHAAKVPRRASRTQSNGTTMNPKTAKGGTR
ncbi:MAG TPA: TetR/AcrR family transcriptional regulator [Candidatus Binatia bacterium]|jgi:AcrR family transcriptional regulator